MFSFILLKNLFIQLIPNWLNNIYIRLFTQVSDNNKNKSVIRKKSDTTQITQHMYDFITNNYDTWVTSNAMPSKRAIGNISIPTTNAFTSYMNLLLGLNKSLTTMAKIFNQITKRDSLPSGPALILNTIH